MTAGGRAYSRFPAPLPYRDAAAVFKEDLAANRNPHNGRSLFGRATTLKAMGNPDWSQVWAQYLEARKCHDFELVPDDLW